MLQSAHVGKQHVVFVLPPDYHETQNRYPAVLTFAGLGESRRGNRAGAWGWVEKYGVVEAMAALHRTKLRHEDALGLWSDEALAAYNQVLREQPFQGLVLVCPFPPTTRRGRPPLSPAYERYLLDELLPYTQTHLRVLPPPAGWGVDGISLGGLLSTWLGFRKAASFQSIGSLQGAISNASQKIRGVVNEQAGLLRQRAIQIATSKGDGYRRKLKAFHVWLGDQQIPHRFSILPGRHDKRFVKGPGSIEMLLFHDRALRGKGALPSTYTR